MKLTGICVGSAIIGFNLLASSEAFALSNSDTGGLNNALGFNAFVFNDLTATGGDTEGRLAVGGNLTVNNSYSVSGCSSPDCDTVTGAAGSQPQSNGTRDDLVVAGDILTNSSSTVSWGQEAGNARVGGSVASDVNITFTNTNGNSLFQNVGAANVGVDFAAQAHALLRDSTLLSQYGSTGTVTTDNANFLTLEGTDQNFNVFNLTAAQWGGSGKTRTIDVPQHSKVLINVDGATITLSGGEFNFGEDGCRPAIFNDPNAPVCEDPLDFSPNTIVNYSQAHQIDLDGLTHEGSFLAPRARLIVVGGVINGQSVLDEVEATSGFEFHFRENNGASFQSEIEAIPLDVNHSSALVAAGVFFGGLKLRKLRQQREKLEE